MDMYALGKTMLGKVKLSLLYFRQALREIFCQEIRELLIPSNNAME